MKFYCITHIDINTIGGLQSYYKGLNTELINRGIEVSSIHPGSHREYFLYIGGMYMLLPWKIHNLRIKDDDIVIVHGPALHELYLPLLFGIFFRKVCIYSIQHGILSTKKNCTRLFSRVFYYTTAGLYDWIFVVGRTTLHAMRQYGFKKNNIENIPAGHNFIKVPTRTIMKKDSKKTIIFVGRLDDAGVEHKNPELLIKSVSLFPKNSVRLIFVSPYHSNFIKLTELCNELAVNVFFVEHITTQYSPEYISLMQESDVLVMSSSLSEAFGIVLLEALNCKTPIICSEVCGGRELIEQYFVGEIFKSNDVDDLYDKIREVILNNQLYRENIDLSYKDILQKYSYENVANIIISRIYS